MPPILHDLSSQLHNGRLKMLKCERSREWPLERMKTVLAALLLFASSLSTSFAVSFLNEVSPRDRPLPDLLFRLVPIQEWAWPVSDVLVVIMVTVCGLFMLLHRYRWIIMRRIFLIAAMLYFFRSLSMLATWMPLSDPSMLSKCVTPMWIRRSLGPNSDTVDPAGDAQSTLDPPVNVPWSLIGLRMWQYGISLGLVDLESDRVLCGDYIYSGHTLMYILTTLTVRTYMPRTGIFRLLRILYPTSAACGMLFVVISRLHYTIDVLIAYWMTTLTFSCYHLLVALPRRKETDIRLMQMEHGETNMMMAFDEENNNDHECDDHERTDQNDRFTIFGTRLVLEYFEKNVPHSSVPRELHWPFSRPIWISRLVNSMNETPTLLGCDD